MNNKNVARGIIVATTLTSMPVESLANTIEEYKVTNEKDNIKNNNIGDGIKKFFAKVVEPIEDYISNPKEVIKVNPNVRTGTVLEIRLTDSNQFVQDLSGNPGGYETVKVITEGDKELVQADYDNLRLSGIPKVDLSNAYSDSIPNNAFYNATHLVDFKFPRGITTIEDSKYVSGLGYNGAFYNCTGLVGELVLPNTITKIGSHAFYNCSGFTGSLTIGNSVTNIGYSAFANCRGFTGSLTIGNSVTNIGYSAFEGCSGFTGSLTIPDSLTSIGSSTFYNCRGFTGSLIIPDSVRSIGMSTFENCRGFTGDLIIPDSVTSIGAYAFDGCSGFNGNLVIPNSITSIENGVFEGCSGLTGNLVIPNLIRSIGSSAFSGCSGFTGNLVIPNLVTSIDNAAFYNCSGFTGNLVIPDSVTSIGNSSFYGCSGFTGNLVIPDSVTSIGTYTFSDCSGIEKIIVKIDENHINTSYRRSIIENLPLDKTYIEISYNFDISNTWLETTNYIKARPALSTCAGNFENNEGIGVSLEITEASDIKTITISKNGENYILEKDENGKYTFTEDGEYQVYIETEMGTISNISFKNNNPISKPNLEFNNNTINIVNNGILANTFLEKSSEEFDNPNNLNYIFSNLNWIAENGMLKSETITDGNNSENEFIVNAEVGEKLQINIKTSSESRFDWGYVYLNGVEVYKKSGTSNDFEVLEFDLEEGENTIKFKYVKDGSGSYGDDAIFVDYIKILKKEIGTIDCDTLEYRIDGGEWQIYNGAFELNYPTGTKVLVEVRAKHDGFVSSIFSQEVTVELNDNHIKDAVEKAEQSKDPADIENARDLVNTMPESSKKDEFQDRLDDIFPSMKLEKESVTANLDIYIKSENMLSLSLNTSAITFDNFSGVENLEKKNAINLTINSSLPYKVSAYMPTDIKSSDGSNTINSDILNIRANGQPTYTPFENTANAIVLLDEQQSGNRVTHGIDLMLKGDVAHEKDVYKTTIKFEVEQK